LPFIIAGIVDATGAQAASLRVGDTVQIVHDVQGRQSNDQSWGSKAEGDNIYENESIRTAVESQARLLLVDRTGLAVGPITTIRIDRMVYSPDQSIKGIVVSAGAGTVRWTSGDSSSYFIRTPTADVTPIGTVFDLFVDSQRTFVILRQGRAKVCTNNLQPKCKTLDNAGEMMLATADELQGPWRGALDPSDFANRCLSANGQNCVINMNYSPPRQAPPREPPVTRTRRADVRPSRPRPVEEKPRRPRVVEEQPSRRVVDENVAAGVLGAFALAVGSSVIPHRWGYPGTPYRPTGVGTGRNPAPRPIYPPPGRGTSNGGRGVNPGGSVNGSFNSGGVN
jgi:ferric-dicitrate binding protein FerR (iron transport regulator)